MEKERVWEYTIVKSSRHLSNEPYDGVCCERAGLPAGKIYTDYKEADRHAKELSKHSRTGFFVKIYNRES